MAADNPYKGPASFDENDRKFFFGREEETRELISLIVARRGVLLYAQSGAGKTSLLKARVIPALREEKGLRDFPIARVIDASDLTSGNIYVASALAGLLKAPAAGFAGVTMTEALGPALVSHTDEESAPWLMAFDQFEEIFTFHPELYEQRKEFFRQVSDCLAAYPQLSLLLAMREEFLADLEAYAPFLPDRMRARMRMERLDGIVAPGRRSSNAVEAIRGPAALAGKPFEPSVAETLVDNLRRIQSAREGEITLGKYVEPVQLQIVCFQLWRRLPEKAGSISEHDLEQFGDVDNALTNFYRDALKLACDAAPVSEREVRAWFGEKLITSARRRGLTYQDPNDGKRLPDASVKALERSRIIRPSEREGDHNWYELAHDRLIEPILEDNRTWRAGYRNPVADACARWVAAGRGTAGLLNGNQLAEALKFQADNRWELSGEESAFLKSSKAEAARVRRNKWLALAAGAIILAAGAYAVLKSREASQHRQDAQLLADVTESTRLMGRYPAKALLLAIAATARSVESQNGQVLPSVQSVLDLAFIQAREENRIPVEPGFSDRPLLDWSSDGPLATLRFVDAGAQVVLRYPFQNLPPVLLTVPASELAPPDQPSFAIPSAAFSPDGKLIALAGVGGGIRLWDRQGNRVGTPFGPKGVDLLAIAFSRDGQTVISGSSDGTVRCWDLTGKQLWRAQAAGPNSLSDSAPRVVLAVTSDAQDRPLVVTGASDGTVRLWGPAGKQAGELATHEGSIGAVDIVRAPASNGHGGEILVASASVAGDLVRIYSVNGQKGREVRYSDQTVCNLKFSPRGDLLAVAFSDGLVRFVDPATRASRPWTFQAPEAACPALVFDATGHHLAVLTQTPKTGDLRFVDVYRDNLISAFPTVEGENLDVVRFSPSGKQVAAAGEKGRIYIWDAHSGAMRQMQNPPDAQGQPVNIVALAFSPGGSRVASGGLDGPIRLWSAGGELLATLSGPGDQPWITGLAFSPGAKLLLSAERRSSGPQVAQTVTLWDLQTGKSRPLWPSSVPLPSAIALSPGGDAIATSGFDNVIRVWRLDGSPAGAPFQPSAQLDRLGFSSDGKRVLFRAGDAIRSLALDANGNLELDREVSIPVAFETPSAEAIAQGGDSVLVAGPTVSLWSASSGEHLAEFQGFMGAAEAVRVSPDGKTVASAGTDGSVRLWRATWREWLQGSCERLRYDPIWNAAKAGGSVDPEDVRYARAACQTVR